MNPELRCMKKETHLGCICSYPQNLCIMVRMMHPPPPLPPQLQNPTERRKSTPPRAKFFIKALVLLIFSCSKPLDVSALGSMSSIAVSYGANGPVFCALSSDGSHRVSCFGADHSVVDGAPSSSPLLGLTAGDGFVCGLLLDSRKPYCWGRNLYVKIGIPQPMDRSAAYAEISAGDNHLCGLRTPAIRSSAKRSPNLASLIDCWGYNMTASSQIESGVFGINAGSAFNCGLFVRNRTAFCWGDEAGSGVVELAPRNLRFRSISAGGFHVCGVLDNLQVFCWGRSLVTKNYPSSDLGSGDVDFAPMVPMIEVAGGRFHACGIKSEDRSVLCWGFTMKNGVPPPKQAKLYEITAGDYFTCGVLMESSLSPLCWGNGGPWPIPPLAVSPGVCSSDPCSPGSYEFIHESSGAKLCKPVDTRVCLPCSSGCPLGSYELASCNSTSDRSCRFNCSSCGSPECSSFCSWEGKSEGRRFFSSQLWIFIAELVFGVVLAIGVSFVSCHLYVRYKLVSCKCTAIHSRTVKNGVRSCRKDSIKIRPHIEELNIRRARIFSYEELEKATDEFKEESQVGKGSFSCVFKGVLKDGTVVAVKRAIGASGVKNSKEFRTELDLLSRLNHAHLLSLLGYCEEGRERLLVYEFMAHGSLYRHLHGKGSGLKHSLDWVRRVTIAVQAARGIEYLHGYACPPVIHRDIKSSNILIDEERNARVSDFGLSLLGPTDSSSPLSELPAGTLGYLDPEYYRLHHLTTKSDVYSFGVLILEILSGRKAIDMQFEEGNIVEWAAPLIRAGEITKVLDPMLAPPEDLEALHKIATMACKCVRMRGKDRPSMDKVTTALERALAMLMGSPCIEQPILPTEVVLGSSRLHNKASQRSSYRSCSENDVVESEEHRIELRAPSWITFPSVTSSQRRKSSVSDMDIDAKTGLEERNASNNRAAADTIRFPEEEILPVSPRKKLFLQHNF